MGDSDRIREDRQLTVRVEPEGNALVVRAFGELNFSNAKTLDAELRRAIGGDASEVILDLGSVRFIDLAALRGLLLMAKQSLRNGGRLRLLRATTPEERSGFRRLRKGGDGISHEEQFGRRALVPQSPPEDKRLSRDTARAMSQE